MAARPEGSPWWRGKMGTIVLVAVPVAITLLLFVGQLVIEREAESYEAELRACFEERDTSERCRVLKCLAEAPNDAARSDCVENRGAEP